MNLLFKYFDKNNIVLSESINYYDRYRYTFQLGTLIKSDHLSKDWLLLLFKICNQCKISMYKEKHIDPVINYIKKHENEEKFINKDYVSIIETNYDKIKNYPTELKDTLG